MTDGRTTTTLVVLLMLSLGAVAWGAECGRVCAFDDAGDYHCIDVCRPPGAGGPTGAAPRKQLCRRLCRADVRACRVTARAVFDCPKPGRPGARRCRRTVKRAFRTCRSEVTTACLVWQPRPRICPQVKLQADPVSRVVSQGVPKTQYVLIDVTLRAQGDAAIERVEPRNFTLTAGGETAARLPVSDLAGPEYCPESTPLPENGTVTCRLAYEIPPGASAAAFEFANVPYRMGTSVALPPLGAAPR